jgi:hypothetical protein
MKRTLVIVTVALVSLGLGYFIGTVKSSVDEKFTIIDNVIGTLDTLQEQTRTGNKKGREDFDDFIYKFISDSLYQLDRIKFPLRSMQADSDDSGTINKADWKIVRLFGAEEYKAQLYDNFKGQLRDTDERLFCWEGVENGINVQYWFRTIDGRWYLTGYMDFSD